MAQEWQDVHEASSPSGIAARVQRLDKPNRDPRYSVRLVHVPSHDPTSARPYLQVPVRNGEVDLQFLRDAVAALEAAHAWIVADVKAVALENIALPPDANGHAPRPPRPSAGGRKR